MKPYGAKFEHEQERNEDLMRAYRECLANAKHIVLGDVYAKVVDMPSARFWVSEERATTVITAMIHSGEDAIRSMGENKQEMFREIYRRVQELGRIFPQSTIEELVSKVVPFSAPKFYITPKSAKVIICRIKRECYDKTKRKLRHLFM